MRGESTRSLTWTAVTETTVQRGASHCRMLLRLRAVAVTRCSRRRSVLEFAPVSNDADRRSAMGRWRAPNPAGSKYITPAGARRLRAELDELWRIERPRVTQSVAEAAAQGDRSENAEYTYGKRRLREIDRRVRFLRGRLHGMRIVGAPPSDPSRVFFGAWITLEDEDGREQRYRIVGPDEFDLFPGYISMDSPLARASMRRKVNDEITVELPGGPRQYLLTGISYPPPESSEPIERLPSLEGLADDLDDDEPPA